MANRKRFRETKSLPEFFDEAKRHGLTQLVANRNGSLYSLKLGIHGQSEPVYAVQNSIATADNRGRYSFKSHIIPVSRSFIDLPQTKASIDELVEMIKAARERQFIVALGVTAENQKFSVIMNYPHIIAELEEYRNRLDKAVAERAFADYGAN